jgi:hypothetical protein
MVGVLSATVLAAADPIVSIRGGNALTLPAQRHTLRMTPPGSGPVWLLAVQQDGRDGRGLGFYRSEDEGLSWTYFAPIQNDPSERSTADLLQVGDDIALVYSFEAPALSGSARRDVYFQWWRYKSHKRTWVPEPPVLVFDSTSASSAYFRAELARDSRGRIWVQAFRLESGGRSTAVVAVSSDGGASFAQQHPLATLPRRGGGRLLSLGDRLIFVYAMHEGFQPTRYRIRSDSAELDSWEPAKVAFSEGIYHGAALSAVATPEGGMHLVYKDEGERLAYRYFDGTAFGNRQVLVSNGDWTLQPATTLIGEDLWVFYNRPVALNRHYELTMRVLRNGTFSSPRVLDGSVTFKAYLNAAERLPAGYPHAFCFYGKTANVYATGSVARAFAGIPPSPQGQPPTDGPDAGYGTALFADSFDRHERTLGPNWVQLRGLWLTESRGGISDQHGGNYALAKAAPCDDCQVQARVVGFGVTETALVLRATGAAGEDRYELMLRGNGMLQIRRWKSGSLSVLAEAPSGLRLNEYAQLSLSASGDGPVTLSASVNGQPFLSATDAGVGALRSPGAAGLWATHAGVAFEDFRLTALPRR